MALDDALTERETDPHPVNQPAPAGEKSIGAVAREAIERRTGPPN